MGTQNKLEELISNRDLLSYGTLLVEFAELALSKSNPGKYIDRYYKESFLQFRSITIDAYWENMPYVILEGEKAVNAYSALVLPPLENPVSTLDHLRDLGREHKLLYMEPTGASLSKTRLAEILSYLDKRYSFLGLVFHPIPPLFLLLSYSHAHRGSEFLIQSDGDQTYLQFLMYHRAKSSGG